MINALTVRVRQILANAGHAGECSIVYSGNAQATVTFVTEEKTVEQSFDLKGKSLTESATMVVDALLALLEGV